MYREETGRPIVELAHMEISEPSIEVAFGRCVEQGATLVAVSPFFLSPGRHWQEVRARTRGANVCLVTNLVIIFSTFVFSRVTLSLTHFLFQSLGEQDIPTLTAEAAANHPGVGYFVAAPLGLHPLMTTIVDSRLETCLAHLTSGGAFCFVFTLYFSLHVLSPQLRAKRCVYSVSAQAAHVTCVTAPSLGARCVVLLCARRRRFPDVCSFFSFLQLVSSGEINLPSA